MSPVDAGPLTLPKDLPAPILSHALKVEAGLPKNSVGSVVRIQGALMTKAHRIYFWRLYSDSVLLLWDEKGEKQALVRK
jgi:hypothetical protein